jgi:hypothetical protein
LGQSKEEVEDMEPITVFCPFTRLEMVDRWFNDLYSTDLEPENTNLCFIIDTDEDEPLIYAKIMNQMNTHEPFRRFLIARNSEHHVNEVNIPIRRQRIAEIHEQSKALIHACDGKFVLGLEDDTVFTGLSVTRLYDKAKFDQVGFVSAYEAGRWHQKIIGIWDFDNPLDPKECWTLLPGKNYEEIDAAGFYCYLTHVELYLEHEYSSEIWQPWGPDVNYGLWLRQLGYKNYVDWEQPCGHEDDGIVISPDHQLFSEHFFKEPIKDFPNSWVRRRP